jgi:hypothetical protein
MSIRGENCILYIYDTGSYKPVACLTSNGLSSQLSMIESTTKCFPGVVKKTPGQLNNSIDAEGEYIDTTTAGGDTAKVSHDKMFLLQQQKTLNAWKIDMNVADADSVKYYGDGYFTDLSVAAGSGDEVITFSVTLDVDGAVLLFDPYTDVPVITAPEEINGTEGVALSASIVASGSPTLYTQTGLSGFVGLSLNPTTGVISGTVANSVSGSIFVYATNAGGISEPFMVSIDIAEA